MTIRLSRHARNNMRLYGITQEDIGKTITLPQQIFAEGGRDVAIKTFSGKYSGLPLKVVFMRNGEEIVVITAYPLKGILWRKSK